MERTYAEEMSLEYYGSIYRTPTIDDPIAQHFAFHHANPPAPFNPDYNPNAKNWGNIASQSMMDDGFYANHSREECATEWRKRYDALKAQG